MDLKRYALRYHREGRAGKIEVVSTKPCVTQRDLSLAYTPGVAEPCRVIARDPSKIYDFTAKGNLVAVVSNGSTLNPASPCFPFRISAVSITAWCA